MWWLLFIPQILIEGFTVNAEFSCNLSFWCAISYFAFQISNLFVVESFFPAAKCPSFFASAIPSRCRSFIKALSNSAKVSITDSIRFAIGKSPASECQAFFDEFNPYTLFREILDKLTQIIKITCQTRSMLCTTTVSSSCKKRAVRTF